MALKLISVIFAVIGGFDLQPNKKKKQKVENIITMGFFKKNTRFL